MKRSGFKRKLKAVSPKKKELQDALEELYNVKLTYWRYVGIKGIYWSLLSQYVRIRDFNTYGTCISCGRKFSSWKESQAGHYAPAGNCGFALLFDKRNINAECAGCNNPRFSPGKLIPYRANLVNRYGEDAVKQLDEEYRVKGTTKEWTKREYHTKILELQEDIKRLDTTNDTKSKD